MKKINIFILISFLIASTITFAKVLASDIDFSGGEITPAGQFKIPLTKLVDSINYQLTCIIYNPSNQPIVLGVNPSMFSEKVNGQPVPVGENPTLPAGMDTFVIDKISKGMGTFSDGSLILNNSDQDFSLNVTGCKAVAIAGL